MLKAVYVRCISITFVQLHIQSYFKLCKFRYCTGIKLHRKTKTWEQILCERHCFKYIFS